MVRRPDAKPAVSPTAPRLPLGPPDRARRARPARIRTASSTSRSARRSTRRPTVVQQALAAAADAPGYPQTIGLPETRQAARRLARAPARRHRARPRRGPAVDRHQGAGRLAAVHLGLGAGDLVVYPELAYPTYEVGAALAGARAVATDSLTALGPERRPWSGSTRPSNPTGRVLPADAPQQGRRLVPRARRAPGLRRVLPRVRVGARARSRCCTPSVQRRLATRASSPCTRCPSAPTSRATAARFVAGDPALVGELLAVRKNLGLIVPGSAAGGDGRPRSTTTPTSSSSTRGTPPGGRSSGQALRAARASGSTTRRRRSTSGRPATRTAGTRSPRSPTSASWSRPGASTAAPAPGTSGWPSPPPTSASTPPSPASTLERPAAVGACASRRRVLASRTSRRRRGSAGHGAGRRSRRRAVAIVSGTDRETSRTVRRAGTTHVSGTGRDAGTVPRSSDRAPAPRPRTSPRATVASRNASSDVRRYSLASPAVLPRVVVRASRPRSGGRRDQIRPSKMTWSTPSRSACATR